MSCFDLTHDDDDDELPNRLAVQRFRDYAEATLTRLEERSDSFHQPPQLLTRILEHCRETVRLMTEMLDGKFRMLEEPEVAKRFRDLEKQATCALGASIEALGAPPQSLLGSPLFPTEDGSVPNLIAWNVPPESKFVEACEARPGVLKGTKMSMANCGDIVIHFKDDTGALRGSGIIHAESPPVFETGDDGRVKITKNPTFAKGSCGPQGVTFKCSCAHFDLKGRCSTPLGSYLAAEGVGVKTNVYTIKRSHRLPTDWVAPGCGRCQARQQLQVQCAEASVATSSSSSSSGGGGGGTPVRAGGSDVPESKPKRRPPDVAAATPEGAPPKGDPIQPKKKPRVVTMEGWLKRAH